MSLEGARLFRLPSKTHGAMIAVYKKGKHTWLYHFKPNNQSQGWLEISNCCKCATAAKGTLLQLEN